MSTRFALQTQETERHRRRQVALDANEQCKGKEPKEWTRVYEKAIERDANGRVV